MERTRDDEDKKEKEKRKTFLIEGLAPAFNNISIHSAYPL